MCACVCMYVWCADMCADVGVDVYGVYTCVGVDVCVAVYGVYMCADVGMDVCVAVYGVRTCVQMWV